MKLTRRQLMKICCAIQGVTITQLANRWSVSDALIHYYLDDQKINGKKFKIISKEFEFFIRESLRRYNMTVGG